MPLPLENVSGWNNASPSVRDSITSASTTYNVDSGTLAQIASIESSFNYKAKNPDPRASATGLFQHTDDTWMDLANKGKIQGLTPGMSRDEILNARYDPQISANGGAALLKQNSQIIGSSEPSDLYLAHFLGPGDAKKVLDAERSGNGNKPLEEILGTERANLIYSRNPNLRRDGINTASDMRNWASLKMTGKNASTIPSQTSIVNQSSIPVTTPSIRILSKARSCSIIQTRISEITQCSINTKNQTANIGQQSILPNTDLNQLPILNVNKGTGPTETSDGLKIKSNEAIAGGNTHPGTFALGHAIQNNVDGFDRLTAFDDSYHRSDGYVNGRISQGKSPYSTHSSGTALDFTLSDPSQSSTAASQTRSLLANSGAKGKVIDEYMYPSESSTGGHIHVNFNSVSDAEKFQQYMSTK